VAKEPSFQCALCESRIGLGLNVLELETGINYWFCNWEHLRLWWKKLKAKQKRGNKRAL
jgi:hypothetical protein